MDWKSMDSALDDYPRGVQFLVKTKDGEIFVCKYVHNDQLAYRTHQYVVSQSFSIKGDEKVLTSEKETFEHNWTLWQRLFEFEPEFCAPLDDS